MNANTIMHKKDIIVITKEKSFSFKSLRLDLLFFLIKSEYSNIKTTY